jgi:hypothetical protein
VAIVILGMFWTVQHAIARIGGIEAKPLAATLVEFA